MTRKIFEINLFEVVVALVQRYARLLPMVLVADIIAGLLIISVPINLTSEVSPWLIIKDAFYNSFTKDGNHYNGPLWLIYYLFWYMFPIAAIAFAIRKFKYRFYLYLCIAILFFYLNFLYLFLLLLGMIASDIYFHSSGKVVNKFCHSKATYLGAVGMVLLLLTPIYYGLTWNTLRNYEYLAGIGFAFLILSLAMGGVPRMAKLLSHPILLELGRISFGIYAIHYLVQLSFAFDFQKMFLNHPQWKIISLVMYLATLAITIVIAYIATFIEGRAQAVISRLPLLKPNFQSNSS